jgi:hypothetical protein
MVFCIKYSIRNSSPVGWIVAGPRQHSRSWFGAPSGPMTIFLFFTDFNVFWSGASSSTRGGVWLLLATTPSLLGSDSAGSHSLTHSSISNWYHNLHLFL